MVSPRLDIAIYSFIFNQVLKEVSQKMVRTNSTMLPLGTEIPDFDLPIVNYGEGENKKNQSSTFNRMKKALLLPKPALFMFICAHCPFVKHIEKQLTSLDQDYGDQLQIIAVSSNSLLTHPQDGPDQLANQAKVNKWRFPYLLDLDQSFASSLKAACTPDFFLFGIGSHEEHKLMYRGQLDDSRPGNEIPVTGYDLRKAIDAVLNSIPLDDHQKPSIGCNIKWHPGKEPDWFS